MRLPRKINLKNRGNRFMHEILVRSITEDTAVVAFYLTKSGV